jgi:hypothetical protein
MRGLILGETTQLCLGGHFFGPSVLGPFWGFGAFFGPWVAFLFVFCIFVFFIFTNFHLHLHFHFLIYTFTHFSISILHGLSFFSCLDGLSHLNFATFILPTFAVYLPFENLKKGPNPLMTPVVYSFARPASLSMSFTFKH